MNKKMTALLCASVLALAACEGGVGKADESTPAASAASAAQAASAEAFAAVNAELKSRDGKLTIKTTGIFTDKSGDETIQPEGVNNESLQLLQHNENENITVYAADLGKAKHKPADYFAKLKKALESNNSLKELVIGEASDKRMDYHFNQTDKDGVLTLSESCAVLAEGEKLYSVCAFSPEQSAENLAEMLQDITVTP